MLKCVFPSFFDSLSVQFVFLFPRDNVSVIGVSVFSTQSPVTSILRCSWIPCCSWINVLPALNCLVLIFSLDIWWPQLDHNPAKTLCLIIWNKSLPLLVFVSQFGFSILFPCKHDITNWPLWTEQAKEKLHDLCHTESIKNSSTVQYSTVMMLAWVEVVFENYSVIKTFNVTSTKKLTLGLHNIQ